jgi:hypothetical protein
MNGNFFTKAGTAGGTLMVIFLNISSEDLIETVILAATAAAVSFLVSYGLKLLLKKRKR